MGRGPTRRRGEKAGADRRRGTLDFVERVIENGPLEVWPVTNLHAYLQAAGRDNDALAQLHKVLELTEGLMVARVSWR